MWKNYLKTAWRNLWKNRFYSLINISGLAIGLAACIVILLFVFYERSFDSFHTKNIYRLNEVQKWEGMVAPQNVALSMFPMGPTLTDEFPEILNFTRINNFGKVALRTETRSITIPEALWADSTFLQLFDFELVAGDRNTALQKPNSVVLTKKSAFSLFGEEDALGQSVTHYGRDTLSFMVTGILEDVPDNSHLKFGGLFSFNTITGPRHMENWGGNWLVTYLELANGTDLKALEDKFPAYLQSHMGEERAKGYELFLQPLQEVHAYSTNITHDYLNYQKFDSNYTAVFSIIAVMVLIIASINFINLSSARSAGRAKEIGVRKTVGAKRLQLYFQFIGESVLLCFIALLLSLVLVALLLPYVNHLSQRQIDFPLFSDARFVMALLIGTLAAGVLSGLYPAAYLSSFQPTKVLKGTPQTGRGKPLFRNILVIGQFSSAVFLIIATVFATEQLRFMQKKDPGFQREQVVTVPLDSKSNPKYEALKQELLSSTFINGVTASQQKLGNNLHQTGVSYHGNGPVRQLATSQVVVDPDFLNVYQISLVAGRNFSADYESENGRTYIINETLARELLRDEPETPIESLIGRGFGFSGLDSLGKIIGVARDFNFNSLHHKIETLCLFNQKDWGYGEVSIKINGEKANEAVGYIQSTWNRIVPESEFEYEFLDDHFARLYRADNTLSEIVGVLTILAILISCLGLFGLASFSAEQRIKEIGIRKVLGATIQNVVAIISRDFIKLVFIANLIAWPLAWYALDRWLQDFAFRIEIEWWVFILAGIASVCIALVTVSFQSIKAALMNPVNSLRTE